MSETLYRIKPLVWESYGADGDWCTQTVFGGMQVIRDTDGESFRWQYSFVDYYDEDRFECESFDDGKAKAEAFYRSRVLPAFEPINEESRSQWKRLYHMRGGEIPG